MPLETLLFAKSHAHTLATPFHVHTDASVVSHPNVEFHGTSPHCGSGSVTWHPTDHSHVSINTGGCVYPRHGGIVLTGPHGTGSPYFGVGGGFDF